MQYTLDDIKKAVRITLEMNDADEQMIEEDDNDTLSMNDVILIKIMPSVRLIEQNAPFYLLGQGKQLSGDITWENEDKPGVGSGSIILPEDFMRPIVFQMSDWKKPGIIIGQDSPMYAMQTSDFAGIRGNIEKPVVAIVPSAYGTTLEFYSCCGGADVTIKSARYLPFPKISEYDTIEISPKLYDAVINEIAAQVATAYANLNVASILQHKAYELAEITTQQPQPTQQEVQQQE